MGNNKFIQNWNSNFLGTIHNMLEKHFACVIFIRVNMLIKILISDTVACEK